MAPLRMHLPKNVSRWGSVFSREKVFGERKEQTKKQGRGQHLCSRAVSISPFRATGSPLGESCKPGLDLCAAVRILYTGCFGCFRQNGGSCLGCFVSYMDAVYYVNVVHYIDTPPQGKAALGGMQPRALLEVLGSRPSSTRRLGSLVVRGGVLKLQHRFPPALGGWQAWPWFLVSSPRTMMPCKQLLLLWRGPGLRRLWTSPSWGLEIYFPRKQLQRSFRIALFLGLRRLWRRCSR